tara:strand:+ start:535 stop:1878 length:1344 start_codon:yes stop_codon:yes gene_type:complete
MSDYSRKVDIDYSIYRKEWDFIRDALRGNTFIKSKGELYLPYPANVEKTSSQYRTYYQNFLMLTTFPDLTNQGLRAMIGLATGGDNLIELDKLKSNEEYLGNLYVNVLRENLSIGRVGLLIEVDGSELGLSHKLYKAEDIIDWNYDHNGNVDYAVIEHTKRIFNEESSTFEAKQFELVLRFDEGIYTQQVRDHEGNLGEIITPKYNGKAFDKMPFYILSPYKLNDVIRNSPLAPIAELCRHIYRNYAILQKALVTKGDPTLIMTGINQSESENIALGATNFIALQSQNAKVYFAEMVSGVEALENRIERDIEVAQAYAGKLFEAGTQPQSGEALKQRQLTADISLKSSVVETSSQYQLIIKDTENMLGGNVDKVKFEGFSEFSAKIGDIDDLVKASTLNMTGIVSKKSIHGRAAELGVTELSYEEELMEIDDELGKTEIPSAQKDNE